MNIKIICGEISLTVCQNIWKEQKQNSDVCKIQYQIRYVAGNKSDNIKANANDFTAIPMTH